MGRALAKPIIFVSLRSLMGFASLYPSYQVRTFGRGAIACLSSRGAGRESAQACSGW